MLITELSVKSFINAPLLKVVKKELDEHAHFSLKKKNIKNVIKYNLDIDCISLHYAKQSLNYLTSAKAFRYNMP